MNGFLFDDLPSKIQFASSLPIVHVLALGKSLSDTEIWVIF